MTPFWLLFRAETRKLMSRRSAQLGVVLALTSGVGMPLLMAALNSSTMVVNGATLSESLDASGPRAALWGLRLRNLWLMQTFVLLLAANGLAGELAARTLREDLLRPVRRSAVLAAKLGAVAVFVALTLLAQFVPAVGLGSLALGADGPWKEVALGYLATWIADVSFAAVAFAVAAVVRSLTGTLVGVLLFIVFEKLASWFLFVAGGVLKGLPAEGTQLPPAAMWILDHAPPAMPSAAWEVGNLLASGAEVPLVSWGALVGILGLGWLIADRGFAWMEVP